MSNPIAVFEMEDGGIMKAELFPDIAPNTVNDFVSLIQTGFYNGRTFHRIIPEFMIQGGGPTSKGLFANLQSSHPDRHDRIARLQEMGAVYTASYGK